LKCCGGLKPEVGGSYDVSAAWPVGSVFISVVPTNPATLLGFGTWAAFAAGRALVGIDAENPAFDTVEETGGEETHTLLTTEIPAHTHTQDAHTHIQNSHNHTQDTHTHTQDAHTHTQNSHNHTQDAHTHTQNSHNHTQDAHNHTQDAHTHTQNSHNHNLQPTTATTGSQTCTQAVFATDTSATARTTIYNLTL